jgi:CDP-diacylglycerol---glycerol-3-phosphate 3-phosphatidyltransferase
VSTADDRAAVVLRWVTYLRVVLTPVVMALVLAGPDHRRAFGVAAALFGVAALTDFVDGRLARRWRQTTQLGSFMDTTADKLLVSGALLALVDIGRTSAWVAFVIIGRELLILGLKGAASATEASSVSPTALGKAKANLQFIAIFLAILRPHVLIGQFFLDEVILALAAAVTVWSALDYLARLSGLLSRARERR